MASRLADYLATLTVVSIQHYRSQARRTPCRSATQKRSRLACGSTRKAEAAANHYVSIFKNSRIGRIGRYGDEGKEIHGKEAGSVMTVEFELEGQKFLALNGGPQFKFNDAISLQINCETQAEVDDFWSKLSRGRLEGPCGWLKDKFGLSWQVVPTVAAETAAATRTRRRPSRVMKAMLQMKKLDIAALKAA